MSELADITYKGKQYKQPFFRGTLLTKLRFALIKLLAGKTVVMLNVHLTLTGASDYTVECPDYIESLQMENNFFVPDEYRSFVIRQN